VSVVDVLDRVRTEAEPGPGAVTIESLKALDLAIGRRVGGVLSGDYRSAFGGIGTEFHQVREYAAGDDVRRIDWNVTARTGTPHVRVELAERVIVTWVVIDLSASMVFGTADRRKADVAEGVAMALGHVATRRGNRLGVVVFGPDTPRYHRPLQGRRGLLIALRAMREAPAGSGRLNDALKLVQGVAVQRSPVVVISDFRGPFDWRGGLLRVAASHPTLAIEIRDPREQELADIGEVRLSDPETGEQLLVDTEDPVLRDLYAKAAAEDRHELVQILGGVGVSHVALSTEGDWLRPLTLFLGRNERR
jgi:uncharacterized protein (DUF58 family)